MIEALALLNTPSINHLLPAYYAGIFHIPYLLQLCSTTVEALARPQGAPLRVGILYVNAG